ncbi:MAG: hypothetical protein A2X25_08960 [Chloroflexi bacterium GWB2_49_20]|nr:MAG: hypothetical protein A2X25_08960 [Chloroflexi bacterium GWB2_49_20]OGN79438.1 MAG: hypothetical protein A2X26_05065 [Chloroflexi bacterium GWC2_49_37]OGN82793.1 MAG: hypothetical protein A2X27_07630 [Chloroflexi bacterium GWD2_49_16]HCC79693.1 hypothetical protein [Anaerolineae bacterium]HCM97265.1 hypothetical protein [Anaerolineae bacterium]
MFVDFDLDLLKQLVRIIDQHLDIMCQKATQEDDLDSFGYFDSAEHITGLGFVACQTYMSSVYGYLRIEKQKALPIGPFHSSGQSIVQIINNAANYWKHNSEWSLEKTDKQRKYIEETFEMVGFPVNTDFPLCGVLTEITFPERAAFEPIISILELWRDELRKTVA